MKNETILSAPETMDVPPLFSLYKLQPGNENKTISEFYHFMTTPCTERDEFLLKAKSQPAVSGNMIRQQYTL